MLDSKAIDRYDDDDALARNSSKHLERSPEFSLKALSRGFVFNSQK